MPSPALLAQRSAPADAFGARFPFQLVALGIVFYATGPVLARSSDTTGVLLSFWRLWFGAAAFALALLVHRLSGRSIGSARGIRLAMLAGAVFSVNQVAFFTAVKRTSVVDVSLLGTLAPILVALLAVPLFGERPGARFRWWSLLGIAGAAYIVLGSSSGPNGDLLGMLLGLLATAAFACFFVISKLAREEVPVVSFLTFVMATAAVCVSGYVVMLGSDPGSVESPDLWRALGMALVPGALGHIAMTWPLRHLPANVPPLFRLATPAVAGLFAWIFLGEGFTIVHVVGGAIIIAGLSGAILSQAGRDLVADARRAAA
ncbi:MAG: drug/metabolite transporter (DMT)-like permease [Acidimicrobiales bacterium]|jgi:drug/metabolite transporter (DMT)-like permease